MAKWKQCRDKLQFLSRNSMRNLSFVSAREILLFHLLCLLLLLEIPNESKLLAPTSFSFKSISLTIVIVCQSKNDPYTWRVFAAGGQHVSMLRREEEKLCCSHAMQKIQYVGKILQSIFSIFYYIPHVHFEACPQKLCWSTNSSRSL